MSKRSLVVSVVLFVLAAGLVHGQNCKLDFRTTRQGRTVVRPLSPAAASAVSDARVCIKSFPWTESQEARVLAGNFPSAREVLTTRTEMRATASKVRLSGLDGTLRDQEFAAVADRLSQESWFGDLPTHMQLFTIRLARGLDARQADTYATWL